MKTITRQYYLASWPFFLLLLHCPLALLLAAVVTRPSPREFLWFLVLIASVQIGVVQMLEVEPSTRYLHPATVPFAVAIGVCAGRFLQRTIPFQDSKSGDKGAAPSG